MEKSQGFTEEIKIHIQAGYPLIYVQTVEEQRTVADIATVVGSLEPQRGLYIWDYVKGFHQKECAVKDPVAALKFIEDADWKKPAVFVLKDFHRMIHVGGIIRYLRNLVPILKEEKKTIIFTSTEINVPVDIENDTAMIDYELPSAREIEEFIIKQAKRDHVKITDIGQFVRTCQGFTLGRLGLVLKKAAIRCGAYDAEAARIVTAEKKQLVKRTGVLEYTDAEEGLGDIGGLYNFKKWIGLRRHAFMSDAGAGRLPRPKGVLLTGIQGTGKSLCAKVAANYWGLPLLRLDIGRLMGSYVGESEERTRHTLKLADALAPCILWIDEVDKAFGGIGELHGDSGTARRVFGTIVTWMQERKSHVFIIATANDIDVLPPEFMRRGRFDEIFFVDLPDKEERKAIFAIHLGKRLPGTKDIDIDRLSSITEGFSGAEIENLVIDAMFLAYGSDEALSMKHIVEVAGEVIPLSVIMKKDIERARAMVTGGRLRRA